MSTNNPAQLIVDTQVFVKLIENNQKQTSDITKQTTSIVQTMDQFQKALGEQSQYLVESNAKMEKMDARLTAVENAMRSKVFVERKPVVVPPPPSCNTSAPNPNGLELPILLASGRYQCPRCLKDYTPGYIYQHMVNRNNKKCVFVTAPPVPGCSSGAK